MATTAEGNNGQGKKQRSIMNITHGQKGVGDVGEKHIAKKKNRRPGPTIWGGSQGVGGAWGGGFLSDKRTTKGGTGGKKLKNIPEKKATWGNRVSPVHLKKRNFQKGPTVKRRGGGGFRQKRPGAALKATAAFINEIQYKCARRISKITQRGMPSQHNLTWQGILV